MGIYIPNMEMPKYTTKAEFGIDADGNPLCMVYHENGTEPDIYDVVPIPEGHGRLGDLDKINASLEAMIEIEHSQNAAPYSRAHAYTEMQSILDDAPTIVPAEGGTDNG